MKRARWLFAAVMMVAVLLLSPAASLAGGRGGHGGGHFGGHGGFHGGFHGHFHGHFHNHFGFRSHVFVGVGPGFWWGSPWWWYPPAYAAPVVVQGAPTYIDPGPAYWYYCASARGYYPSVPSCPEAWIPVPPTQ